MQFTLLALPAVFLGALAAPTPAALDVDTSDLTDITSPVTDIVSDVDLPVRSLQPKRQADDESIVSLLDGLLVTISPIVDEIESILAGVTGSVSVEGVTDVVAVEDVETLLDSIVAEVLLVTGDVTESVTSTKQDVADVLGSVIAMVDTLETDVTDVTDELGVEVVGDAVDSLNVALNDLIGALGEEVDGLLTELDTVLSGLDLEALNEEVVPVLGGLL